MKVIIAGGSGFLGSALTRALVAAVRATSRRPSVFIQGSAMGYYGTAAADVIFDESSRAGSDFLGRLCVEWEAEARPVEQLGCRLAYLRSGIVLGHGGALAKMRRPFLFWIGQVVAMTAILGVLLRR